MMTIKSMLPQGRGAWILLGGISGIILLGAIIAMGPIRNKFVALNMAKITQEQKMAHNLAIVAQGPREAVEEEYRRYGNLIKMQGSSDEENSRMLSEVDRLAVQNKVVLSATKPREIPIKDRDFESYAVTIEVESDMSALMGFVYAVESSPQLLRVDRLTVDAKGGKNTDLIRSTLVISKVVTLP